MKLRHQRRQSVRGAARITRRRALGALLGLGGLGVGSVGGLFALRGSAPDVQGLKALNPQTFRTFKSLAEAVFSGVPGGDASDELARAFDGYLSDEPKWARDEANSALTLLEFGPVFLARRLKTFSHLSVAERIAHFESWATSENGLLRQAATGFRKFLCLVFYDRPPVWPLIGYDGPLIRAAETPP